MTKINLPYRNRKYFQFNNAQYCIEVSTGQVHDPCNLKARVYSELSYMSICVFAGREVEVQPDGWFAHTNEGHEFTLNITSVYMCFAGTSMEVSARQLTGPDQRVTRACPKLYFLSMCVIVDRTMKVLARHVADAAQRQGVTRVFFP